MEKTIGIIGFGRVGGSFALALRDRTWRVNVLTRFPDNTEGIRFFSKDDVEEFLEESNHFLITVMDSRIQEKAEWLSRFPVEGKVFLHMSGALPSSILKPLKSKGAHIGSLHPLQTFPERNPNLLKNIYFAFEGDEETERFARLLVQEVESSIFRINPEKKVLYHAAAVFASNFADAMWIIADMLMREVSDGDFRMMEPLVRTTLENALRMGPQKALTGPARRRDTLTIQKHLRELKKYPRLEQIYDVITGFILKHFEEKGA